MGISRWGHPGRYTNPVLHWGKEHMWVLRVRQEQTEDSGAIISGRRQGSKWLDVGMSSGNSTYKGPGAPSCAWLLRSGRGWSGRGHQARRPLPNATQMIGRL